jgi:pyruvate,water dikinase
MTVESCTEDFRVVWTDPADAELHWGWDKMHNPRPVAPLVYDLADRQNSLVFSSRTAVLNGYIFAHGFSIPTPPQEVWDRGVATVWEDEYAPRIREACVRWRSADYARMSATELAGSLEALIQEAGEAMLLTMVVAMAFGLPTSMLADFCEEELGADGGQLAAALLQGYDNVSAGGGAGLGELAETALKLPAVAAALRERRYEGLESLEGGPEFVAELRSYLDEYGWRAETWGRLHVPTWAEDPRVPLMLIGRYLADASATPAAAMERAVGQREEATREVESRLSGEKLERFRELLAKCESHVRISEGRAFWQLTIDGSVRVPLLALGAKLVEAGTLDEANDIFFLRLDEVKEAATGPARRLQKQVGARKADLARWETLSPPAFVGGLDTNELPAVFIKAQGRFWGGEIEQPTDGAVVKGNPAARGIARGRARLIMDLGQADRLEQGEILVCPSTAPPWTPLFAIAAAVVTDTGGILSHSAICAREYGIPCVVGTKVGTQRIPDGAMVAVDGGAGTIRIEG